MSNRLAYLDLTHARKNALNAARQFAAVSPAMRLLVAEGRISSPTHKLCLRIAIAQLQAKVKRGRSYNIQHAMLRTVSAFVEA